MRNKLLILILAVIVVFSGCSLPVEKSADNLLDQTTQGDESGGLGSEPTNIDNADNSNKVNDTKNVPVVLFYQDVDGYIIPITRNIEKQDGIARATVSGLIDNSMNREEIEYYGVYPVFPKGTEVLGLTIKDGIAVIDFNNNILNYDSKAAEKNIVSSIVYTLTAFNTVTDVRILIDGREEEKLKYDTDISGVLNRENILINANKVNLSQGMKKLDIYLLKNANENYSYLLPVSIEDSEIDNDNISAKIISYLTKDYTTNKLYSEIPVSSELLNSSISDGVLTLDFNTSVKEYGGNAREEGILRQILYSMKQIKTISKIKILIEGKEDNLPEGTDISKALPIPNEINAVMDLPKQ